MDNRAPNPQPIDPRRDEWTGIKFLLGEMDGLHQRGLVLDDAYETIKGEYSARLAGLERNARFEAALRAVGKLSITSPRDALAWATQAKEIAPDRPEGWVATIDLLQRLRRFPEADDLAKEAAEKFPNVPYLNGKREEAPRPTVPERFAPLIAPIPSLRPPVNLPETPKISWSSVAGEFLEEHWQKLISCLAVLLIVVSSTVGANLVLGPLLWSPMGKGVLALLFTSLLAGFGVGLVRWGAARAGQMMLATSLILVPINLMLAGELRLLANPSSFELGLVAVDSIVLFLLARAVVSSLGIAPGGTFTGWFFALAIFNAGASRGMPFEAGFAVFLFPAVLFLGAVAWLNARVRLPSIPEDEPPKLAFAYLEFGLLAFAFLGGVIRTGALVLQLVPALYAVPTMLAAIAGVSTARALEPIEKDRQRTLLFQQGGLVLSALAFALALTQFLGSSALYSGNTLAVASLGLALYATSLRATRKPAYLYCGFAAIFLAYFGAFYFAQDLVRSVEEAARQALGYHQKLPMPFKAINGLVFSAALALLARFFARQWSDDRLAKHCHYIGLPLSIAACVFSGFEPKAAVICLGGYTILYAIGTRLYAEPLLIYLACSAAAGSAFFGATLAGGATLGLRSLIASILGLVFWTIPATPPLRKAGLSYQTPLIHAARVMAAFAMASATIASIQAGMITPLATLAFLLTALLALLNGHESPRVSIYLLAIAALLGAWLGGYHILIGGQASTTMAYGLAIAGFTLALLTAGEALRAWLGSSEPTKAYLQAIGWGVPVVVLLSWSLASWSLTDSVTVARSFLTGSVALLWLTRFRREPVLVYLGLAGLTTWASCLCGLVVPWDRQSDALAWQAVTWAGCSIVLWGVGEWVRRRGSSFYYHPYFLMAGVLAAVASGWALEARWFSADTYRIGMAAMFTASVAFGLIASSRRWLAAVVLAAASVVGACDLGLVSQGRPVSQALLWLGMASAAQAIAARGVGWLIRRTSGELASSLARPLDFVALALMVLAIPLGYQSPTTLLLIAASTSLMVGCFPSVNWLYGTFLAVGSAVYWGGLSSYSGDGLIPFVMLGAYLSWGIGVALQHFGSRLRERLGPGDLALHGPPVVVTVGFGVLATAIRVRSIVDSGGVWSTLPWLPWTLAGLCLLMLRFEPRRAWVHAAVGLTGLGFAAILAPFVEPRAWWLSAAMALATFWAMAGQGAARFEGTFRRRLGIAEGHDSGVLEWWALAAFVLSGTAVVGLVLGLTFLPSLDGMPTTFAGAWSDIMLALGLAGLFVAIEGRRAEDDGVWIGFEAIAVLAVWWLGAPGSPLFVGSLGAEYNRLQYLPLATATCSLIVVGLGRWTERRFAPGVVDPSEPDLKLRSIGLRRWTCWFGFGLGLASVYLSFFSSEGVAFFTYILATAALGALALGWRRVESAIAGGLTWCMAWPSGLVLALPSLGLTTRLDIPVALEVNALGMTIAIFGLWWLAGWVRARGTEKGGEPVELARVARAFEWVAIVVAVPTALLALLGGPSAIWLSVGLVFSLAVFFAMVAGRKGAEWPVYVAQLLLLACYFRVKTVVAPSSVVDAVVLSMLGYLDLGLSELLGRLRLTHYARPTFRFAMVLPLVPVVQRIWVGSWDGVDLFVLLATALFYAMTSVRLRIKTPAYAAAVFFNAFLWLGWYLLGWSLSDRPQFYLIPVGFTSILFAEVNRRELSRSVINGARNLGLVVIYASLAAPIWQTQSSGAWLALLLLSLVGIFVGIGLRIQSFLWLGLACFVADLAYQLGRLGMEHALARWGVMLTLGVALILFVALNEKKRIVATMRKYYDEARSWE